MDIKICGSKLFMSRYKPYTNKGISRVPCAKCGKPSFHQWNICSLGKTFNAVCIECDIELNKLILNFFNVKNKSSILKKYINKQGV